MVFVVKIYVKKITKTERLTLSFYSIMMLVHSKLWNLTMSPVQSLAKKLRSFLTRSGQPLGLFLGFVFALALIVLAQSCSSPEPTLVDLQKQPAYEGWKIHTYKTVNILYPPDHLQMENFNALCEGLLAASRRITQWLGTKPYTDSLYIVYYTGLGHGRAVTGKNYPFVSGNIIHFWQPSFATMPLADLLIEQWSDKEPNNPIMKHGLRAALDFAGTNYHKRTSELIDRGEYIPLTQLAVDSGFLSDSERIQSAFAASFVTYVLVQYGASSLRQLYESDEEFNAALEDYLGINEELIEINWLNYVREQAARLEQQKQNP